MIVPVKDEQCKIRLLNIPCEVIYLRSERNGGIAFYTRNGKYTLIYRLSEWASILKGPDFARVDRGTIVNLNQPWEFISDLRVMKYQDNRNSLFIPVSENNIAVISDRLRLNESDTGSSN